MSFDSFSPKTIFPRKASCHCPLANSHVVGFGSAKIFVSDASVPTLFRLPQHTWNIRPQKAGLKSHSYTLRSSHHLPNVSCEQKEVTPQTLRKKYVAIFRKLPPSCFGTPFLNHFKRRIVSNALLSVQQVRLTACLPHLIRFYKNQKKE